MKLFITLLCLAAATALPEKWSQTYRKYEGYKVLEVFPHSSEQVATLRTLMLTNTELDFWQEPSKMLQPVHIMAGGSELVHLKSIMKKYRMDYTVLHEDLDQQISAFIDKEMARREGKQKVFDIDDFNTYDDIMDWLQNDLLPACTAAGHTCDLYNTPTQSVEGRDIPVFTVNTGTAGKQWFVLDSTIHAREWLAPATNLKIMDYVVNGRGSDLLNNVNFVFMPVLNPDGYVYSWTDERLWRKNRQPFGGCTGVDLNRNSDYMFGLEGASSNPCSDTYCGPSGNSEPETQALHSELAKYAGDMSSTGAYITFHSYGYMWMHPWGNTVDNDGRECELADDHQDMFDVAVATADAIEAVHNTRWARGTSCEVIYETTGATDDYAKAVHGIKYPYNPELRGNGFIIDKNQIQPSFEEVWAGIEAKAAAIGARSK